MHPKPPVRYVPAAVVFCLGLLLRLLLCFIWQRNYYQTHAQAGFTPRAPPFFLTIGVILIVGASLAALLSWYILISTSRGIRLKQAGQALGKSEARLAAVVASAMDAVITVDSEQRVTLFNAAAERIFRCSAAEVLGQTIDRFIPERSRAVRRGHIQRFGTTGETTRAMGALGILSGVRMDGSQSLMTTQSCAYGCGPSPG